VFVKIRTEIFVPAHQKELRQQFATPLKALKEQEEMRQAFANPMRARSSKKNVVETTKSSPSGSVSSADSDSKKLSKSS
jgi:hypothetical protein